MTDETPPHSQLHFTDSRDHWWNDDFVALLAKRFGLGGCRRVLDVGAGQGHFTRVWAPHLAKDFEVTCVDREARSLAVAAERCAAQIAELGLGGSVRTVVAAGETLPFDADTFDLVMCQTLLMHVVDPAAVVAEMTRVARPGGTVLAAEPNNLALAQRAAVRGPEADVDTMLRDVRYHALIFRGKAVEGRGWNHLGIHLPRYFTHLRDVRYYTNDKPWLLVPPYDDDAQRAQVQDFESYDARGIYGWERDEARRCYVAGGGRPEDFEADYEAGLRDQRDELAAIRRQEWVELGAVAMFVAAGRKP